MKLKWIIEYGIHVGDAEAGEKQLLHVCVKLGKQEVSSGCSAAIELVGVVSCRGPERRAPRVECFYTNATPLVIITHSPHHYVSRELFCNLAGICLLHPTTAISRRGKNRFVHS